MSEQVKAAKRCDECVYYHATGRAAPRNRENVKVGECRCGPPQNVASITLSDARWPLVFADEWCGVHMKPDPGDTPATAMGTVAAFTLDLIDPEAA